MVHDWFVHKRSTTEFVEIPLVPGDDWSDPSMEGAADRAGSGPGRLEASPRLREPERPLVGRLADLRVRSGRGHETANGRGWPAEGRRHEDAAGRSRQRRAFERVHRELVGRAGDAAHAVHVRAQPHLRRARQRTSRLERRAAVRQGEADQLRPDGEDSYGGMDLRHPAASHHPARHAHELVRPQRSGSAGSVCVPRRGRTSRRPGRLQGRPYTPRRMR